MDGESLPVRNGQMKPRWSPSEQKIAPGCMTRQRAAREGSHLQLKPHVVLKCALPFWLAPRFRNEPGFFFPLLLLKIESRTEPNGVSVMSAGSLTLT